jgi:hypothetical protein
MIELPPRQAGPAAWYGPDLARRPDAWTVDLEPGHIDEVDRALRSALAEHADDIAAISSATFPLPTLGPVLESVCRRLIDGCGFALIRGLPIERYDQRQAAAVFFGIGAHLGNARPQNAAGHILGHVRDVGKAGSDTDARIYQTNERQTFHTDSADVVGLLCLKQSKSGGESLLVSAETLYNEFLERRPDLLPRLFDPIATDRRGEVPAGMKPYFEIPVFSWFGGRLTVIYQRQYIDSAQRFPDAPRLTPDHVAALDLFDELADDPALHLIMRLEPGDMQFVYNHALLHDRRGFEDWPEPERRRHLFRLWLAVPGDRPLPDAFVQRFGTTTIGDRGGIVVPGTPPTAPIGG